MGKKSEDRFVGIRAKGVKGLNIDKYHVRGGESLDVEDSERVSVRRSTATAPPQGPTKRRWYEHIVAKVIGTLVGGVVIAGISWYLGFN